MSDIAFITGSRSEYSLMRRTLLELSKHIDITIVATGMHLSPKFGYTVQEIERDGFRVKKVDSLLDTDTLGGMAKSVGVCIYGVTAAIEELSPEFVFVEGDRGEALAGALAGAYLNIPVIHHGGGDVSGSVDNKLRYAITMLSDYHLVGNPLSFSRLVRMGIPEGRIFNVGEPGIDDIYAGDFEPKEKIAEKYNIDLTQPMILFVYHPNTMEYSKIYKQMYEIMEAIKELGFRTIAIYSNADAGGRFINRILDEYAEKLPFMDVYPHVPRREFLGLMNACDVMVGNSSAGIVELPSFKKPFVCIGTRQENRLKAGNVLEVGFRKEEIVRAIKKALFDGKFRESLNNIENPYGDGKTYLRICRVVLDLIGMG